MQKFAILVPALFLGLALPAAAQCQSEQTATASQTSHYVGQDDIITTAVNAGSFKTLAAALTAADLVAPLQGKGPFTVFAPTDEAFAKLPKGTVEKLLKPENRATLVAILTYHVVPGNITADKVVKTDKAASLNGQRLSIRVDEGNVFISGAKVLKTDIECSNGVIHVIDTVMLPNTSDIIDTAVAAGSFNTLAAALKAAALVEALKGEGPFTVFAPTDEAFAKLPAGTVESLLKPENREKLQAVLKYHVVSGRIYADQALKAGKATTLQGGEVWIMDVNGTVQVGKAKVLKADLDTSNGVIHVIDTVLLP